MNKKGIYLFLAGLLFAICCYLSFSIGQSHPKIKEKVEIVRDTLIVRDTMTIKEPIEKIRWKEKDCFVYVPVTDTLIFHQNDTTYIAMQEEKVEYQGEDYKAIISGVNPKLDEISVYPKTVYVTETQKETKILTKHWNFHITVGPGVIYNGKNLEYGIGGVCGFGYSF